MIDHRIKDIKLINSDMFTFYDRRLERTVSFNRYYQSYRGICLGFGDMSVTDICARNPIKLKHRLDDIDELYSPLLWEIHGIKE